MEFPAEVPTNSFALDGSSDLAYVICVLAKPGNPTVSDSGKESESSSGTGIGRLRNAENELRKAKILVSLDLPKGELYTFYRKEDLQKDGKSLFSCVATILRKNECTMASKQATKTGDLLRPDRVKLYRQFKSALLSMIKSVVDQNENLIVLDPGTFLFRDSLHAKRNDKFQHESGVTWGLVALDTQVLLNGQLMLHCENVAAVFKRVASICESEDIESYFENPTKVLFAPTGQYARYTGGYLGKLPRSLKSMNERAQPPECNEEAILEQHKQGIWKDSVQEWFRQNELDIDCSGVDEMWIEIDVPLCKVEKENLISPDGFVQSGKILWKTIFWPTSLCFVNTLYQSRRPGTQSPSAAFEDPLAFAEDWLRSADDREAARKASKQRMDMPLKHDPIEDVHAIQNHNAHLDSSQLSRRVPILEGPAAATIYPTPPDGALSHVTPGVMSVDGQVTSPAEGAATVQVEKTENNAEMIHSLGSQTAIGSGLYDEDLFEDVPGQKFGQAEIADEPNWDFFDEPDPDTMQNVDDMEIDMPEKPGDVTAEDQGFLHSDGQRPDHEVETVPPGDNDGMGPQQSEKVDHMEGITHAEDAASVNHQEVANESEQVQSRHARRISPPLSPVDVKKRLFIDMENSDLNSLQHNKVAGPHRRSLLTDSGHIFRFKPDLKVADSRYSANGLFWFDTNKGKPSKTPSKEPQWNIPKVGIPKRERDAESPKTETHVHSPSSSSSAEDTDFDSSDFFSDSNKPNSPDKLSKEETDSLVVSPKSEDSGLDRDMENKIRDEILEFLELLRPELSEQSSIKIHQPLQRPSPPTLTINRDNLLTIGQVVVDQVSQSFCHHDPLDTPSSGAHVRHLDICEKIQSVYGSATELNLTGLVEISTGAGEAADGNGLMDIHSPFIRLGRADAIVDVLPTILPFWETLGLQPLNGKKNIAAVCIHPTGMHIEEGSSVFLQRLSEVYSNCNLGSHTTVETQGVSRNGLIEWPVPKEPPMYGLLELCQKIGPSLAAHSQSADYIMVYVINPFNKSNALVDICTAFVELFSGFAKACAKSQRHELILQIVPMSFIASSETIVIPSQTEYFSLALEVYNRCPPINSSAAVAESGAAVTLVEPAPKNIHFSLTTDATSPLSKDEKSLHLAYSQSTDMRWMVACWTDNLGKTALTMTYCLREKGSSVSRPRSEVIKELWEISADIMTQTRGKWRLSVAHDGPIDPDEINEWSFLANQQYTSSNSNTNSSSYCILTLLTFDTNPTIQFLPQPSTQPKPQPQATVPGPAITSTKYGTPASASTPMTSSPEQLTASTPIAIPPTPSGLMTAPTPPEHLTTTPTHSNSHSTHGFDGAVDPETTLHDPTSESWSLILPFGLNNSKSPLSTGPAAMQSGFLLKRRGVGDGEGVVGLGVNLVHTSTLPSSATAAGGNLNPTPMMLSKLEQKNLLREIIRQWRALVVLGRTRGVVGGGVPWLPWHIRTAVVGVRAVGDVL